MAAGDRNKVLSVTMAARDKFTPVIKAARLAIIAFRRTVKAAFAVIRAAARAVGRAFKAMLGPIGLLTAALTGLGLLAIVRKFHQLAVSLDEVAKQARATGANVQAMQELAHVAVITGTNMTILTKSVQRVVRAVAEASQGVATYADSFKALNLNVAEMERLDPVDQFTMFAEAMGALESNTARVGIAMEIFGARNLKILNLINENADAIHGLRMEARDLGIVLDSQTLGLFEEWIDAWERIKAAIRGLMIVISINFLPLVLEMAAAVKDFFVNRRGDIDKWSKTAAAALEFVAKSVKAFGDLLAELFEDQTKVEVLGKVLMLMGDLVLSVAKETVIAAGKIVLATMTAFIKPILDAVGILGETIGSRILVGLQNELLSGIPKLIDLLPAGNIRIAAMAAFSAGTAILGFSANDATEEVKEIEDALAAALIEATATVQKEMDKGGKAIKAAADGIGAAFKTFVDGLTGIDDEKVQGFLATLKMLRIDFEAAMKAGADAGKALEDFKEKAAEAASGAVPLSPQQIENLARLREEITLLGLRGSEREAAAAEQAAEREIRAKIKSVEGIKGAEADLAQFIKLRRQLLNEELLQFNGTFLDGIQQGFADWKLAISDNFRSGISGVQELIGGIQSGFESAFEGIITGTKSVSEAFKDMGKQILQIIAKIIAKQIALFVVQSLFGGFGFAKGGVVQGGLTTFAAGGVTAGKTDLAGVVDRPTLALVGEGRQREAVIPLPDGRRVEAIITDPVQPQQGEVNVTFEIHAVDTQGFQQLLTKENELITNMIRRAMSTQRDMRETVKGIAN